MYVLRTSSRLSVWRLFQTTKTNIIVVTLPYCTVDYTKYIDVPVAWWKWNMSWSDFLWSCKFEYISTQRTEVLHKKKITKVSESRKLCISPWLFFVHTHMRRCRFFPTTFFLTVCEYVFFIRKINQSWISPQNEFPWLVISYVEDGILLNLALLRLSRHNIIQYYQYMYHLFTPFVFP